MCPETASIAPTPTLGSKTGVVVGSEGSLPGRRSCPCAFPGGLFFIIVAPIAALLIQLAISRSREYAADEGSVKLTGSPMGLASALRKLGAYTKRIPMQTAQPTTAHMMIANPFSGGGITSLFATHPPMEKRVARLEAMVGRM